MRSMATEQLLMLEVKSGRQVVCPSPWWEWQTKLSPKARYLDPWLVSKRHQTVPADEQGAFLWQTKENWREEAQVCLEAHCGCQAGVLNLVIVKRGETDIPGLTEDTTVPRGLGPKRASRMQKLFSLSMSTNMVPESPETKKVRSPEPKPPRFSILLLHVSCNTSALRNNMLRKTRRRLQNVLNF